MTPIERQNWMQVEQYLQRDDRCVLPLGSTEQHAYLSLCVDNILPERLAREAAAPLGVPVFPVVPYGVTPYFRAYPGSVTLRVSTYLAVVRDLLDGLHEQGFRRILIVNGHGGNSPAQGFVGEWMADHPGTRVKFHNWWNAPQVWAQVQATDPNASHASWMENFPWTRLDGVTLPGGEKAPADLNVLRLLAPQELRAYLGEGNYGGRFQRPDADMQAIWDVAVSETRALLDGGWSL
ncbi:creatininase family protein (plasmid) [Deinococcus taeanensis]|uniref:creatininase family protein n=1 Tax=Deinococcus taeanensis TaxID=2737050 RepID=UPI001CDD8D4F|nr:creatininase family protein [Deinococcus taeanensis]UBV44296.1 creatininase family protein [Deinococcus taeanensis]